MADPLEDTQALSAEEVAERTGEAEEQDESGAPEKVAETEQTVPIGPTDRPAVRAPHSFVPEDAPSSSGDRHAVTEPMYSTDEEGTKSADEPGDSKHAQEPADREPRPGNATAPGQRPSDSGATPSDIPTEADENAHRDHTLRRRPS